MELKNIISNADDDYLIGLTNKGVLKRAYKDLDEAEISAEYSESTAEITVSDQKCTITSPLGDSKCTCPSRSICRHIIAAILWLKNNLPDDESESNEHSEPKQPAVLSDEFKKELSEYPLKLIQKAMKKQYLSAFLANAQRGKLPELEETTIISSNIERDNVTVKLLHPLEYSTCSCHSKEICKHKAEVILTWQLKHGIISLDEISSVFEKEVALDIPYIHNTAKEVENFLSDILSNGLVRISDDIYEYAESMAVMCHNAKLADLERLMREIGNRLRGYVMRSPEFSSQILFLRLMEGLMLAKKILAANDEKQLILYMGEFKETYIASDTLDLIPVAVRDFSSVAGYAGEIYYFINKNTDDSNRFLTYSNIRPTFYETRGRSKQYLAPWGLTGNISEIMSSELRLENPKLSNNKISSSNETKAKILNKVNLNQKAVLDNIYRDFKKMIVETFANSIDNSQETLILLSPKACVDSVTDEISQTHSIVIEDYLSQRLTMKVKYKNTSKEFFNSLIRIGNIMKSDTEKQYTIFANAYLENGKCCLYPIAIFDEIQLQKINEESESQNLEAESDFKDYGFFVELFHSTLKALCDIIQCGINSYDLYEHIYDFSQEYERSGLSMIGGKILKLYNMLKDKNHTYSTDNSKIILLLIEIYNYISIGIEKTELHQAVFNLTKEN